jgi:hypothetical protein
LLAEKCITRLLKTHHLVFQQADWLSKVQGPIEQHHAIGQVFSVNMVAPSNRCRRHERRYDYAFSYVINTVLRTQAIGALRTLKTPAKSAFDNIGIHIDVHFPVVAIEVILQYPQQDRPCLNDSQCRAHQWANKQ